MSHGRFAGPVIWLALAAMAVSGCIGVPAVAPATEAPVGAPALSPTSQPTPPPQDSPTVVPTAPVTPSPQVVSRAELLRLAPPLTGHKGRVTHLVFSRDGQTLASGSEDGFVVLWDVRNPAAPVRLDHPMGKEGSRVRSFALSPDGKILVISTSSGTPPPMHIAIWNVADPAAPALLSEPPPVMGGFVVMYDLAFSPDGRVLAIGSEDRTVSLWDMTDPAHPAQLSPPLQGHKSAVRKVVFSSDGRVLASGEADGTVILWNMNDPKAPARLATINEHNAVVSTLALSPDGRTLAIGGNGVRLWDISKAEAHVMPLGALPKDSDAGLTSLDFSPDGNTLAGSSGKTLSLWDVSDRTAPAQLAVLRAQSDTAHSVAFSADGKTLATGGGDGAGGDGAINLWSVVSSNLTGSLPVPPPPTPVPALEWPLLPLTAQQVAAVKGCDIESLAGARYPDMMATADLQSAFAPQSGCDWAVLALAYATRLGEDESLPEAAKGAFSQAVSRNFGFALATPLFYRYFGSIPLAKVPAFARQEITGVRIKYDWSGLGDPVNYALEIQQANTTPTLSVTPHEISATLRTDLDKALPQALAPALTDLLPVGSNFRLIPCTDNYLNWDVTLTFADGTTMNLTTGSNFLFFGGPWFTEVDNQAYIQYSPAFAEALRKLVTAAGLPVGQPGGMTCFGDSVFDKAFP